MPWNIVSDSPERHATSSDLHVKPLCSFLPAMALTIGSSNGSRRDPASEICCAAVPAEDSEDGGCCCCHCYCSCCSCDNSRGNGVASCPWSVAKEACGPSTHLENRSSVPPCRARGSPHQHIIYSSAFSCIKCAQVPYTGSTADVLSRPQGHCGAVNRADFTSASPTCRRHSGEAATSATAASSPPSRPRSVCRSSSCLMAADMRPKRLCICMVSDFFFPSFGGVEMHIYELSVRLARKGFKVIVVTHAIDGRHGVRFLTEGLKVYYLPLTCFHDRNTLVTFFTTLPLIRTILIRERVDIVHGHQTTSTLAHEAIFHARHLGYRVVYTDHSMFSFADAACIHINKVLKFFLTHCDHCICVSHTHKENLVLRGALNPHQIAVINNAVDVPSYGPNLSKRPPPPAINILILSRLSYRKGIDLLIDMIPAVCAKYPNVTFIIGGDGPKRIILEEMREKHRIHDRVEMLEAAACGLVVVSTDVGGIPEVLPPDMVLLAPPNPAALTLQLEEAIRRVERGDIDPHAVHQRVLEMYSWEDVANRVEQVYFSALFDLPMSANLRKGISLANVPLPPNPPPLPTSQGAVQILRALNRDSIEEAASFPSDVLDVVEKCLAFTS